MNVVHHERIVFSSRTMTIALCIQMTYVGNRRRKLCTRTFTIIQTSKLSDVVTIHINKRRFVYDKKDIV